MNKEKKRAGRKASSVRERRATQEGKGKKRYTANTRKMKRVSEAEEEST